MRPEVKLCDLSVRSWNAIELHKQVLRMKQPPLHNEAAGCTQCCQAFATFCPSSPKPIWGAADDCHGVVIPHCTCTLAPFQPHETSLNYHQNRPYIEPS